MIMKFDKHFIYRYNILIAVLYAAKIAESPEKEYGGTKKGVNLFGRRAI